MAAPANPWKSTASASTNLGHRLSVESLPSTVRPYWAAGRARCPKLAVCTSRPSGFCRDATQALPESVVPDYRSLSVLTGNSLVCEPVSAETGAREISIRCFHLVVGIWW